MQCLIYSRCVNGGRCGNYQPAAWQLSISWPAGHAAGWKLRGSCLAGNGVDFNCCWEHCLLCFQCSEWELNRPLFFVAIFAMRFWWPLQELPSNCLTVARRLAGSCLARDGYFPLVFPPLHPLRLLTQMLRPARIFQGQRSELSSPSRFTPAEPRQCPPLNPNICLRLPVIWPPLPSHSLNDWNSIGENDLRNRTRTIFKIKSACITKDPDEEK